MAFGFETGQKAIKKAKAAPKKVVKATPSEKAFASAHGVSPKHSQVSALPPPKRVKVKTHTRKAPVAPPKLAGAGFGRSPGYSTTSLRQGLSPALTRKQTKREVATRRSARTQQKLDAAHASANTGFDVGPVHVSPLDIGLSGVPVVGFGGDLARMGATKAVEEFAPKVVAKVAESAPKRVVSAVRAEAKGAKAARVAERGGGGLKNFPKRIATAPKRIAGKAVRAPGVTARTAGKLGSEAGRKQVATQAGAKIYSHPIAGVGALAATTPTDAGQKARALVKGTEQAVTHHFGETALTTARGLEGIVVGPADLVLATAHGGPPGLLTEALAQYEGIKKIGAHMLSGDPKVVQKAVQKEGGGAFLLPLPAVGRGAKSALYDPLRGSVRVRVEKGRAATRAKRTAAERTAVAESAKYTGKEGKPSVADTHRPGESYVVKPVGRKIENRRSREHVSLHVTRMGAGQSWGERSIQHIAKQLHRSKAVKKDAEAADTLKIQAGIGIANAEHAKELRDFYPSNAGEAGARVKATDYLDRHAATYAAKHPEVFTDKHLQAALSDIKALGKEVGYSGVHQYRGQAQFINHLHDKQGRPAILMPEERISAEAKKFTTATDRVGAWQDAIAREEGLRQLKAAGHLKEARKLEKQNANLVRELTTPDGMPEGSHLMKPPEHGGAKDIATTRAVPFTKEMGTAFVKETEAARKAQGLRRPSPYVADVVPHPSVAKSPRYKASMAGAKDHIATGRGAREGNALSSFEDFMGHSHLTPRVKIHMNEGLSHWMNSQSYRIDGVRYLDDRQVGAAVVSHKVPDGAIALRTQAVKAPLEGDRTLSHDDLLAQFKQEVTIGRELAQGKSIDDQLSAARPAPGDNPSQLYRELQARQHDKGEKYLLMPGEQVKEMLAQLDSPHGLAPVMRYPSNFATRTVLNSPAWVLAQSLATSIPLGATMARDLWRVPAAIDTVRRIAASSDEKKAYISEIVGSSAGTRGTPETGLRVTQDKGGRFRPRMKGRRAQRQPVLRGAWNLVSGNTMGKVDRSMEGRMREVAAAAKVDGDFRRAVRSNPEVKQFWEVTQNLFAGMHDAVEAMKGMSQEERFAYSAAHPELGERVQRLMNDSGGNWNSYTRFERDYSPVTLFWPFLKYATRWTLWNFPMHHPIAFTTLNLLAQQNANTLDRINGGALRGRQFPLYAQPVIQTTPGAATKENTVVYPIGSRISPGLSAATQGLAGQQPSQLIGVFQPVLGTGASLLFNKDSYTGQSIDEPAWKYAVQQTLSLSPAARLAGAGNLGKGSKTVIAKAFDKLDSHRGMRSVLDPFIGVSGDKWATAQRLSKALDEASRNSSNARSKVLGDNTLTPTERGKKAARMKRKADEASQTITDTLKKVGLAKEDRKSYNEYLKALHVYLGLSGSSGGSATSNPLGIGTHSSGTGSSNPLGIGAGTGSAGSSNPLGIK